MPVRLRPLPPAELSARLAAWDEAVAAGGRETRPDDVRALVKHFLAVLSQRSPGRSVEVRIPPFAAAQCIEGARHTRGTPPAVVETDAQTWIAMARGKLSFAGAVDAGKVRASGERSDLSPHLPLI